MTISRRTVLKGLGGISLTLPYLASLDAQAQAVEPPKRFIALYHPNGVYPQEWNPTFDGITLTLGKSQAALEAHKSRLLYLRGLNLQVAVKGEGEQHQRGIGALLTGQALNAGSFIGNDGTHAGWAKGISIDQELVGVLGRGSKLKSLQLGVKTAMRDVSGALSYSASSMPLLPENNPQTTFDALFGGVVLNPTQAELRYRRRKSVLDAVKSQLDDTRRKLSQAERAPLDAHLTAVRELEQRLSVVSPEVCPSPSRPGVIAYDTEAAMPEVAKLQLDLLALAFACDLTRVGTVCFADAQDHIALPFLNLYQDVHGISHLSDSDANRANLGKRDAWQAQQLAYLMDKLSSYSEGSSTVLDRTLIFWGTEVSRGNTHAHDDMPLVLAGGGAGFQMGRFVTFQGQSHNDLLVSILRAFGGSHTTFGDPAFCAGPLSGL